MTPNHMLTGLLLGYGVVFVNPEILLAASILGFFGGLFPDIDAVLEHRKTLHFPVYYTIFLMTLLVGYFFVGLPALLAISFFFLSASIHCITDYFVVIEKDSNEESQNGVIYLHPFDKWVGPKPIIKYAGSPQDLLIGLLLGSVLLYISSGLIFWISVLTLILGVIFSFYRMLR